VVNTKRRSRTRGWLLLGCAGVVIACSCADAHVGCSPTLTCALRDARFAPPLTPDAGPHACDPTRRRCAVSQLSAGGAHTCAVTVASELLCWGDDSQHQLGEALPQPIESDAALPDAGLDIARFVLVAREVKQVAAGGAHTCALGEDGNVRCWGRNTDGQVDSAISKQASPKPHKLNVQGATQIAAGAAHSCAVVPAGVMCWGSARYGQVGREIADTPLLPELVANTDGAVEVAAGVRHSCARLMTGRVLCWGELFDPDSGDMRATPVATPVEGLTDATSIVAGAGHSCALRAAGVVTCWGANTRGQLGNGTTDATAVPTPVMLPVVLRIAAGGTEREGQWLAHTCAVDTSFHVWCWGNNSSGQLGAGSTEAPDAPSPQAVRARAGQTDTYLTDVTAISLGGRHSCALESGGPVVCWGDNSLEQLGASTQEKLQFGRVVRAARFGRGGR
jgi:hypothetical protein